jgi:hypothetical protein
LHGKLDCTIVFVIEASYIEIHFAVCVTSQAEDLESTVFFLHSIIFVAFFSEPRVTCFLDHLVRVTRSSTCTSLTSSLEKQLSSSLTCCDDSERENEVLVLGEDDLLIAGLVCVATSFLRIMGALLVAESFMLSIPPSAQKETKRSALRNLSISA